MADIRATVEIDHDVNPMQFAWKGLAVDRADAIAKALQAAQATNWLPKDDDGGLMISIKIEAADRRYGRNAGK